MVTPVQFRSRLDGIRRRVRVTGENGISYDSKIEAKRGAQLALLQSLGQIKNLRVHPRFDIVVNGQNIATYVADFDYYEIGGRRVVEDVKPRGGRIDPMFRLKVKLMRACLNIDVIEVNL